MRYPMPFVAPMSDGEDRTSTDCRSTRHLRQPNCFRGGLAQFVLVGCSNALQPLTALRAEPARIAPARVRVVDTGSGLLDQIQCPMSERFYEMKLPRRRGVANSGALGANRSKNIFQVAVRAEGTLVSCVWAISPQRARVCAE
jgi:hypothetical protein